MRVLKERLHREGVRSLTNRGREAAPQGKPTKSDVKSFWEGVIGEPGNYNLNDPNIKRWRESVSQSKRTEACLEPSEWQGLVRKTRPWKAPGPDTIVAFWWKAFSEANRALHELVLEVLNDDRRVPSWMVRGRTFLVPKEGCEGRPEQYRPITCLNTSYKLLTGALACLLGKHVETNGLIPYEQKALRKGRHGCVDALLYDSSIRVKLRTLGCSGAMGWIDYQKAYDRVPHGWLLKVLKTIRAPKGVIRVIKDLLPKWESEFTTGRGAEAFSIPVTFRRGLFQGDSLSPLLFCLCVVPLSHALQRESGLRFGTERITHLFFMDDLKVYAGSRQDLKRMLRVVDQASEAVGMALGLRKCAAVLVSQGKVKECENLAIPNDREIGALGAEESYRYLVINQSLKDHDIMVKQKLIEKYLARLNAIWSTSLSGKTKVKLTNSWAISVFRYYFSCLKWTRTELKDLDVSTRRVLRRHKSQHYNSALERLYLARTVGG